MASVSVFSLTRFTALAAGDVIPAVDVSDTTQSAHGSLDSITVTNFFKLVPVTTTFGVTAVPAGISGIFTTQNWLSVTPDTNTNVARGAIVAAVGYGSGPKFFGLASGGTVTIPTATASGGNMAIFNGGAYDGTAWAEASYVAMRTRETWAVGAHGSDILFATTDIGATSQVATLVLSNSATTTRLVPLATAISFRNAANSADNLLITDAGAGTFRAGLTVTGAAVFSSTATVATSLVVGTDPTGTGVLRAPSLRVGGTVRNVLFADTGAAISVNYVGVGNVQLWSATNVSFGVPIAISGAPITTAAGQISIGGNTRTTIGANGAATALTANPLGYIDVDVAGTVVQIPYYNRGA